jgi:hypothetical protein
MSTRSAFTEHVLTQKLRRDTMKLFENSAKEPRKVCVGRNTLKFT